MTDPSRSDPKQRDPTPETPRDQVYESRIEKEVEEAMEEQKDA